MLALILNHFYDQDIEELERATPSDWAVVKLDYQRWWIPARLTFSGECFTALETPYGEQYVRAWRLFKAFARAEVRWLESVYAPSVVILPSDSVFYFRPFIEEFQRHHVPVVVVQKETTISPLTMEEHSRQVSLWVPPIADLTTVCSERQREFWLRSGAAPERITVTGQPRFDYYSREQPEASESFARRRRPVLLYLSFDDYAYLPDDHGVVSGDSWIEMRRELEMVLARFGSSFEIWVKHHPQQRPSDFLSESDAVTVPAKSDTRQLILSADVIVGFQSTAIFESAIARKPTIYVGWGDIFRRYRSGLVEYESLGGNVRWASSPEVLEGVLRELLSGDLDEGLHNPSKGQVIVDYIGPIDGKASERVWQTVAACARPTASVKVRLISGALRGLALLLVLPFLVLGRFSPQASQPRRLTEATRLYFAAPFLKEFRHIGYRLFRALGRRLRFDL